MKAEGEREFLADSQRMADEVSRGVKANVPVTADTRGAQSALAGLQGASDKLGTSLKNMPASVDSRGAQAPLAALQTASGKLGATLKNIPASVDPSRAASPLQALQARADGLARSLTKMDASVADRPAQASLLRMQVGADKLTATLKNMPAGADTRLAQARLLTLEGQADRLRGKLASIPVSADTARAVAELEAFRVAEALRPVQLAVTAGTTQLATGAVTAGAGAAAGLGASAPGLAAASSAVGGLKAKLDPLTGSGGSLAALTRWLENGSASGAHLTDVLAKVGNKSDEVSRGPLSRLGSALRGAFSNADKGGLSLAKLGEVLGKSSSGFLALVAAGIILSPVLITVGTGLAGLGLAAAGVIGPVLKAGTATAAARKALEGLDPAQKAAYDSLGKLKAQFGEFGKALEPQVLDVFSQGLSIASGLMKDLQPVAKATGTALGQMLGAIDAEFRSGTWQKFFAFMAREAGPDVKLLTDLFVQLLEVLPPLVEALQPLAEVLLKDTTQLAKLIGWLEKIPGAVDNAGRAIQAATGQTDKAAKSHSTFGDAVKRTTAQILNGIVPGLGTALPVLQKYADGTDKSGKSTGKLGDQFTGTWPKAQTYAQWVQQAADATKHLMDNQSAALDKQTAYGNAMVISANDAAALRDRLNESAGKVGLHTQKERDSFSAANTYIGSLEDQAKQAFNSGHGEDAAIAAIRNGLPLLDSAKTKNKQYWQEVKTLTGWLHQLELQKFINTAIHVTGSGKWSVSGTTVTPGVAHGPQNIGAAPGAQAGAFINAGTGPTADDVLIRASKGELVVPANMVSAGAVDHLRGSIPGFAAGGVTGSYGPGRVAGLPPWAAGRLDATDRGISQMTADAALAAMRAAQAAAKAAGSSVPGGGGGAARWSSQILTALAMLGQPASLLGAVERRMNQESGGNPFAVNLWDSNAARGTPSVGVMQVIGPTYASNSPPGWRNLPPMAYGVSEDVLANTYAGLHHAITAYRGRSLASVMLQAGGYAKGGLVGVAEGLIPGMATGGVAGDPHKTQAALRFWLGAAQYGERRDYLGLAHAFAAGPARYRTATVRAELATLAKRQAAEQSAYSAVVSGSMTQAELTRLGAAAKAEETTARDKALSHLPGGHPGWVSGLEHYLGQVARLSGIKLPPPPQTIWTRDPDLSALLAAAKAESTAFWKLAGDTLPKTATRAQRRDLAAWDRVLGRQQVHTFGFGKGGLFQQLMDSFHNRKVPPWTAFGSAVDYLTREVEGTGIPGGINPPGTPHQSGWTPWHYFRKDWQTLLTALRTVKSKLTGAAPWKPGSLGASHTAPDGVLTFDRGGTLPPGLSLSYNGLGRPEHLTPDSGGGGITIVVNVENRGWIGDEQELQRWLVRQLNQLARTGSLAQAIRTGG